jgi:hypothetical protein
MLESEQDLPNQASRVGYPWLPSPCCISGPSSNPLPQRVKECNRIAVMVEELGKCGVVARELPDGIEIEGRPARDTRPAVIRCHDDHRVAMRWVRCRAHGWWGIRAEPLGPRTFHCPGTRVARIWLSQCEPLKSKKVNTVCTLPSTFLASRTVAVASDPLGLH